jgi:phosphate/sulfate permease
MESIESVLLVAQVFFKNQWTRMEKIAAAAIICPILATLIGWVVISSYLFVQRVDKAIDQLDEIHKSQSLPKKGYSNPPEESFAHRNPPPSTADVFVYIPQ